MTVFDVATFGTSLTACNASSGGMWQPFVERSLSRGKSSTVRMYNCGGGGWDSQDGLAAIGKVIRYRPKAITIEFLMNDCNPAKGISMGTCATLTSRMIDAIRDDLPDCAVYLATMNPALPSQTNRAALPAYNDVYRALSGSKGVGLIDTHPFWGSPTSTQIPDGVHPTLVANRAILVPAFTAALAPLVP